MLPLIVFLDQINYMAESFSFTGLNIVGKSLKWRSTILLQRYLIIDYEKIKKQKKSYYCKNAVSCKSHIHIIMNRKIQEKNLQSRVRYKNTVHN